MSVLRQHIEPIPVSSAPAAPKSVTVLGATGSIGENTLDLVGRDPEAYRVVALTAGSKVARLAELAILHKAELAVIADETRYAELKDRLAGTGIEAAAGRAAVIEAAGRPADWTMAAIVGVAGLEPTLAAVAQGNAVAVANKECLVSAGSLFMAEVARHGATLIPVDSEHAAAAQLMTAETPAPGRSFNLAEEKGIERLCLTASGGPFRDLSRDEMAKVTPERAIKHPTWSMGRKVSLDSATLMNKALEMLEAHHLFGLAPNRIDALIHPQSVVHCLVYYRDGAVLAQMSPPDMRTPIAYSLAWPERMPVPMAPLDLAKLGTLSFESPDEARFPALRLAREALAAGGNAGTVLNAANEVAGEAFLAGEIGFLAIAEVVESALTEQGSGGGTPAMRLEDVTAIDRAARASAQSAIKRFASRASAV
ncbi:1-deoxy-D-xylulose-5-phosphate reductoisomerase [Methyloligella sp. 2.7D]|uniref:1-deoxy-D-xylulose-5-phosphate reductoisomerase n=1 Tax=unclassified Methyloligella TaxID=2625955 RepID=UPI00157C0B2C|nr:1-deoxy-D-xylulose-5-phosphate reductoisomerase [Methyloligella sp. GL2]QKP77523.1 1-deoxy-D-xylulose-5-phosphate reductoisomerase [Methyloligella sp. GL2]